jgi:hypothetical protein
MFLPLFFSIYFLPAGAKVSFSRVEDNEKILGVEK